MKKNLTSKNARLLSELEENSCMSNQTKITIENNVNLSNDTIKINTEIKSFMDDTGNELQFYLQDDKITNDTEKCQKASTYINWRGMDYVNLLLSEKENYNISCVVEKWNEKQKSFETSIAEKTNSTCSTTKFDYCAILNKNDKCNRPYEYNDLRVSTLLTYDKLSEDTYSTNKTQIIEDRQSSFHNITNFISDYYYRMYENDNSELNCGKWSMYIYKRGMQFVKMFASEFYDDERYINDSIRIWNDHSIQLETTVLEDTKNQCNMTKFIYQIREQQKSNNPYDLPWLLSKKNHNEPNETIDNTTELPDNLQPTIVTPNVLLDATTTNLSDNKKSINNNKNGTNASENTRATSVPSVTTDQNDPKTSTTISPIDSIHFNSLTPNDTMHSITNTISHTTSSSPFSETLTSLTSKTLPSHSTINNCTPTDTSSYGDMSSTATIEYPITAVKSFTNNIAPSSTITPPLTTASLPPESATSVNKIIPTNSTESPTIDSSSPEVEPSLTTITRTPTYSSTPPLLSPTPTITTLPSTNNPISPTNDMSIHPTNDVTHKTATSPLTHSSSPFLTNTIENSTTTIEPFTNKIASPETDLISPAINTTSLMSDIISPTPLLYSSDNTSILTTKAAFFPTTNNNLPSNQTDSIQLENQQNTHAPLKLAQQYLLENNTGNVSISPNATVSNSLLTPSSSNNPTDVMPTVTPTDNLLIPMVSGGIFIFGIIFLLVLLCKYTPIGSWLRNRKSKKKKARKKIKKITREPLLMDTNNIENEPINNENYSFLHHEKEIPLCDMSLKNRKDLKYKQVKKSKAHKGMYMENEKDLKYKQVKKSKAHKGMHMENEKDMKYEEMKKSKPHEGMYMENENKCIREVVEVSKKHENEFILGEKLNEDNPRNEIDEIELNVNKSRNKIKKEKLNKNILGKNTAHNVEYIMENTLSEEETNEIYVIKEKYECENEMKNLESKRSINDEVCNWNSWVDIHMTALLQCRKEEWKLNKTEFFNICLEEFEKDRENSNLKEMGNNFVMKIKGENSTVTMEKNSSILEKYKNEKWFINLKKEWKQEQEKYLKYLEEHEIKKMTEMGLNNFILGKKKNIWKIWIERQRELSYEYKKQKWFVKLLEEYEQEEIHENLKEENIEKERDNGIDNCEMKKNLERRILLDIHMMVLEECMKEEWEKEEGFYKTNIIKIRKYKNLDEETNILEKMEKERSLNVMSEKKKEEMEEWKKEKWFIELMLEWKNNEKKYMIETNEEILVKKNKERIIDVVLERKSNIWKKHCENICKKWKEEDNNEEWFTKLVNEYENEEKEYKSTIYKNSIEEKKEDVKTIERDESVTEFNKKGEEKMRKYERNSLEESFEENNSIINKKKLKWKTLIEIYMVILEECRKEEWLLNRGKFLETCLEEFKKEEKEKYPKIIENDLAMMRKEEEDISIIMIEKQKHLWKKWVERNKRMSEKWKKEEWFINLKKEWGTEQEKYEELTKESEIFEIETGKNPMLEKQKRIWKQWLKKQRMRFIEHSEEEWFNNLLVEYEKEEELKEGITKKDTKKTKEIHENIVELKQEGDEEIVKYKKKEKLIQKVLIEIHMTLLEECMKDEWQKEKEYFFKTMMEELKIQENLDEDVIILEIKKKRSRNAILDIEKVEIEKWKKKKWFIELILEMNNKEKTYIKDIYEDMIAKKNEDVIKNPMLEMQKIIWKKQCEDIHKRWLEKSNEGCFTTRIY
ncbi:surface-associated interspersed protein (SURFIN) [Plasmodium gallinaceum]|uniref:Surface-associated interspersed protein (SURFIN) n=1 Tax=Plasmodium gallinaceum TaxID=5849 RepID=A0A1J1GXM4_PLAGA|nr:surface-associated interspersed protein (SURFIN) [Plasmodium gallinaceum]CRG96037.1 surface-associated interspersed protein (SURFIN) [Plasmodium gallinaceum]